MEFIRARSEEQKEIRIRQICDATLELFDTIPCDKITLVAIAKKLDFSRANLYKYVSSKEEIFLLLLMDELDGWIQDMMTAFQEVDTIGIGPFSLLWSQTLFRHERLLKLASILFTVIEKNVTAQALGAFKKQLFVGIGQMYPLLKRLLPGLSEESILTFLDYQLHYIAGVYPSTVLSEIQEEAIRISGIPYVAKDFVSMLSGWMTTILSGLYQLEQEADVELINKSNAP